MKISGYRILFTPPQIHMLQSPKMVDWLNDWGLMLLWQIFQNLSFDKSDRGPLCPSLNFQNVRLKFTKSIYILYQRWLRLQKQNKIKLRRQSSESCRTSRWFIWLIALLLTEKQFIFAILDQLLYASQKPKKIKQTKLNLNFSRREYVNREWDSHKNELTSCTYVTRKNIYRYIRNR